MPRIQWPRKLSVAALALLIVACGASISLSQSKKAKDKDKDKKEPNVAQVRSLESQAEKAKEEYVKGLISVAQGFEEQGLTDKTKETLRTILNVVPDFGPAQQKLKEIEESVFKENSLDFEVDATKGWTNTGVGVAKDKPFRLQAEGTLRVVINETVGPEGLAADDPLTHQIISIPTGALMGVVRDPRNSKPDDKVVPFTVGKELEFSSKADGILFLKLNLPANTQSKGKFRVTITGNFQKLSGS